MTLRRIITAGAVLALTCLTAPVALANGTGSPPLQAAHYDGRSPDTKDAAYAVHRGSRTTYASAGASSVSGPPLNAAGYDGRSPDTKDAAAAHVTTAHARAATTLTGTFDGRSPDTKDAAAATHAAPAPVIVVGSTSFDWTDAGIGAAAGFGLAIIAAAAGLALTRNRGTLTTS
jgi:hypothetical protein